jgi:uncharacterized protein (DUF433 family)
LDKAAFDMAVDGLGSNCDFMLVPVELTYPHIVKEPGKPARLERHARTRVALIVMDYQGRGWSVEEIVRQYSYLTLAEVHAALAYYHDHVQEIDEEIEAESAEVERLRRTTPESPLLKRLRSLKAQAQRQG